MSNLNNSAQQRNAVNGNTNQPWDFSEAIGERPQSATLTLKCYDGITRTFFRGTPLEEDTSMLQYTTALSESVNDNRKEVVV